MSETPPVTEDPVAENSEAPQSNDTEIGGLPPVDYSLLETIMLRVLKTFFPAITVGTAQTDFWAVYQKEAEVYDREFVKKHDDDFNITLIFAGLFSAVTAGFIVYIQGDLKPDSAAYTAALILVLIQEVKNLNSSGVSTNNTPPLPDWKPQPAVVNVQAILYASLASSLFAALLAVLGKQWLNRYMRRKGRSQIERNVDRQTKLDGMKRWCFSIVMDILPLMLQIALLLFGCALSSYLWIVNGAIATVALTFTALGTLTYTLLVIAATISYACPYQTPLSAILRSLFELDAIHTKCIPRFIGLLQTTRKSLAFRASMLYRTIYITARNSTRMGEVLPTQQSDVYPLPPQPPSSCLPPVIAEPLFPFDDRKPELRSNSQNIACVSWILEHSTDSDVIYSAIRCVPDLEWHPHVDLVNPPVLHTRHAIEKYFDKEYHIIPGLRDGAIASVKAYVHCLIQDHVRSVAIEGSNRCHTEQLPIPDDRLDDELTTLMYIDYAVLNEEEEVSIFYTHIRRTMKGGEVREPPHLIWMAHILVQFTWWQRNKQTGASTAIDSGSEQDFFFELYLFAQTCISQCPPDAVIADLVIAIGLTVGIEFHADDLSVRDKSKKMGVIVARICDRLDLITRHATNLSPSHANTLLGVLRVLVLNTTHPKESPHWQAATQSLRNLLSTVVHSGVDETRESDKTEESDKTKKWDETEKWEVAHLALKLEFVIVVDSSQGLSIDEHHHDSVFLFLKRQLDLPLDQRPDWHEESLAPTLRALRNSVHANTSLRWKKDIVEYLRLALDVPHSKETRLEALDVMSCLLRQLASTGSTDIFAEISDKISSILGGFWNSLPAESRIDCCLKYVDVLRELFKAPESHSLFLDQIKALKDISELVSDQTLWYTGGDSEDETFLMTHFTQYFLTRMHFASLVREIWPTYFPQQDPDTTRSGFFIAGQHEEHVPLRESFISSYSSCRIAEHPSQ